MKIDVQITGLETIQAALKNRPKEIFEAVELEFKTAADEINKKQKQLAPKDMGGAGLTGAINYKRSKALTYELVAQKFYAPYMEFGTKRRARVPAELAAIANDFQGKKGSGSGQGFYDSILEWVKRKGITGVYSVKTRKRLKRQDDNIEDEQVAFAIYLSIIRHGVKPQPFFYPPFFEMRPKLIENVKKILVA